MKQDKAKQQLISELDELRNRISKLETRGTECKQVEQILQENEQKYRSYFLINSRFREIYPL